MSTARRRVFDRDFKVSFVKRPWPGKALRRSVVSSKSGPASFRSGGGITGGMVRRVFGELGRPRKTYAKVERVAEAVDLEECRQRVGELERKIGQQQVDLDFFREALRRIEETRQPSDGLGVKGIHAAITAMMSPRPQGEVTVEAIVHAGWRQPSRYNRQWAQCAPRQEETAVRDVVQRVALANRCYGYRRIAAQLRRKGFVVNHKRVLRLMQQDNLLVMRTRPFVPVTTNSVHQSARLRVGTRAGANGPRSAVGGRYHLCPAAPEFAFLAVLLDAFSRRVIGWALEKHLRASLAIEALEMAIKARRPTLQCDPSFGSWRAVCLPGVHADAFGAPTFRQA